MMQAASQSQGTLYSAAMNECAADVGVRRYEYLRSRVARPVLKRFSDTEFMEHSCAEQHVTCSNVPGKSIRFFSDGAIGHSITLYREVSTRHDTTKLPMAVVFQFRTPRWLCHSNVHSEKPNAPLLLLLYCTTTPLQH